MMEIKLKRIDRLVLLSFLTPYVMSFLIAEFVLVMQFLWKYIDDITGKGISLFEILELVFYFGVTIIPRAIPISILLSSVFVFGNMSEKFELTSMKSAGVSLLRVMRAGIYLAIFTSLFSILASNVLVPKANFKFFSRFDAIRRQKPALSIEEGMFNDDFYGYKIYVKNKHKDNKTVEGVLIYDQTSTDLSRVNMITAEKGVMETSPDGRYFIMNLENGEQIRELKEDNDWETGIKENRYPFTRTTFKSWNKVFDMSEFDLNSDAVNLRRRKYDLMNSTQLIMAIDSVSEEIENARKLGEYEFNEVLQRRNEKEVDPDQPSGVEKSSPKERGVKNPYVAIKPIPFEQPGLKNIDTIRSFLYTFEHKEQEGLVASALGKAKRMHLNNGGVKSRYLESSFDKGRFILRLNQKYSWAMICIIFLFVGAPLGAIIRKGGYGYPLLMAILFFMLFIILMIMGEKLHRSSTIDPYSAAWLPCIVILPIAAYFTYKALIDSKLLQGINYMQVIDRFKQLMPFKRSTS